MGTATTEERVTCATAFGEIPVLIRRSARRQRTLSARYEGEQLVVLAPMRRSAAEQRLIGDLVERVIAKRPASSSAPGGRDAAWLSARADRLRKEHFPELRPPASVTWVTNQSTRWGSTSIGSRTIRLSHELAALPEWVIDSVLVHELAHLIEPNHGPRFHALTARYARTADARHFLAGVEHGRRLAERKA